MPTIRNACGALPHFLLGGVRHDGHDSCQFARPIPTITNAPVPYLALIAYFAANIAELSPSCAWLLHREFGKECSP